MTTWAFYYFFKAFAALLTVLDLKNYCSKSLLNPYFLPWHQCVFLLHKWEAFGIHPSRKLFCCSMSILFWGHGKLAYQGDNGMTLLRSITLYTSEDSRVFCTSFLMKELLTLCWFLFEVILFYNYHLISDFQNYPILRKTISK